MEKELRINLSTVADLKGIDSVKRSFSELERESLRAASSQRSVSSATTDAAKSVDHLSERIGFMGHAYIGFQAVMAGSSYMVDLTKDAIRQADTWNLLEGRLKLVTSSKQKLIQVESDLFDISQESRTSFESNADLYARISRSTQDMNKSQQDTLDVTEAISKSFIVSGAAAESAKAAVIQLGQGFASGVLRGEELNSVLEQAPRLAEAIANGMGVSVGQLKTLGEEGKLTTEKVYEAIRTQKDAIEKEFDQMPKTVGQSLVVLTNQIGLTTHEFDQMHGVTTAIASAISDVTVILSEHSSEIGNYIGYIGTAVTAVLAWKVGIVALNGAYKLHEAYVAASTISTTSYSIATNTTTASVTTLTARQVAANAALGAWNRIVAVNPYAIAGAAIIGIGLVLKNQADELRDSVQRTAVDVENLSAKALQAKITYATLQLDKVNDSINNPSLMKSMFGNERIDLHKKVQLESDLRVYGKQLQKLHEEANKVPSGGSGEKINILTDKERRAREKADREAEAIYQAYLSINKDIANLIGTDHDKAIASIDEQAEKYRKSKLDELTIAKFVSASKQVLTEKEVAEQNKLLSDHYKSIGEDDAAYYMQLSSEIDAMVKKGTFSYDQINQYRIDKDQEYLSEKVKKEFEADQESLKAQIDYLDQLNQAQLDYYNAVDNYSNAYYMQESEKIRKLAETGAYSNEQMLAVLSKDNDSFLKDSFAKQYPLISGFISDFDKAMENQLFDAMTGKWESFGNWLKDFWSSMTTSIARAASAQLSDTLISGLKDVVMGSNGSGLQNFFSGYGNLTQSSSTGVTLSDTAITSAGGKVGESFTSSGGTVVDGSGGVVSSGSDISSLIGIGSSLSNIYSTISGGVAVSGASAMASLGSLATSMGWTTGAEFFGGTASGILGTGSGLTGAMGAGASLGGFMAAAAPVAAAIAASYIAGRAIDKWTGSDTYGFDYGGILKDFGKFSTIEKLGILATGGIFGGLIGKTKVTGSGYYFGSEASADYIDASTYVDYKKKSWFSSKKWTSYTALTESEKSEIQSIFETYDYLLNQLGSIDTITLAAGKYSGTTFQDQIAKNFISTFMDIDQTVQSEQFSAIYDAWTSYAKGASTTVAEALTNYVSTYVNETRSFTEWKLGSGTSEQLKFTSDYLASDLAALENMMGISGVTVDNFLSMYDEAIKNSFTTDTIDQWNNLAEALMKSSDAANAYTEALKQITTTQITAANDMMLSKVNDATNSEASSLTPQLLVAIVRELKNIRTDNLFVNNTAVA